MESIVINGRAFGIARVLTDNRNATARLRDGQIVIGIPSRWPAREKEKVAASLLKRAAMAIEKGRWKPDRAGKGRARFFHGQRLKALGREFEVLVLDGRRFGARLRDGMIEVRAPTHAQKEKRVAGLVRREITRALMPALLERVNALNEKHFAASIRRVAVRDNLTRWGSCSPDCSISLNFRLLFMPEGVLDYVIVHELAHTRYKSHGPRFWALVERALPDHRERRKWLRENGQSVLPEKPPEDAACGAPASWMEEPY